jgi:hypothetical protein
MRLAALTLVAGLATAVWGISANAAPVLPNLGDPSASNIIPVAQGCGRGWHRHRGYCVRNHRPYAHRLYRPYRPYYRAYAYPYYGGGYYHRPRYWYGY